MPESSSKSRIKYCVDWNKCVLCHADTSEKILCPLDSKQKMQTPGLTPFDTTSL